MTNDISRIAHGGKALYGARVGILMLETRCPRIPAPGKRVGVLTVSAANLTQEHLIAAGVDPDIPVVGTENGREFSRVMLDEKHTLDAAAAEQDILDAGDALVARHGDIGAIVL